MPVGIFLDLKSPSKIDASSKWIFMKRQKIGSLHSIILNNPGNSPKKRTEISNEPNYQNAPKKKHKRFPNLIKGRVCEIFCRKLSAFWYKNFYSKYHFRKKIRNFVDDFMENSVFGNIFCNQRWWIPGFYGTFIGYFYRYL